MEGLRTHNEFEQFELTPEKLEMVMKKVQDINENGTAYTMITSNSATSVDLSAEKRIKNVFSKGILNPNWLKSEVLKGGGDTEKVLIMNPNEGHKGKRGYVFFNIVGKTKPSIYSNLEYPDDNEINHALYMDKEYVDNVALIFDLEKYNSNREVDFEKLKEAESIEDPELRREKYDELQEGQKPKSRKYSYNPSAFGGINLIPGSLVVGDDGLPKAASEYGHALSHRVPPRFFKGVVLKVLEEKQQEYIKLVVDSTKESGSGLLPIYDELGNLLWPKLMTHEEIMEMKKEEAARDASDESVEN